MEVGGGTVGNGRAVRMPAKKMRLHKPGHEVSHSAVDQLMAPKAMPDAAERPRLEVSRKVTARTIFWKTGIVLMLTKLRNTSPAEQCSMCGCC